MRARPFGALCPFCVSAGWTVPTGSLHCKMKIDNMVTHTAFDLSAPSVRRVGLNGVVRTMEESARTRPQSARPDTSFLASLPRKVSETTSHPRYAMSCAARHEWWSLAIHKMHPTTPRKLAYGVLPPGARDQSLAPRDEAAAVGGSSANSTVEDGRWPGTPASREATPPGSEIRPRAPSSARRRPPSARKPALDQRRPASAPCERTRRGFAFAATGSSTEVRILPAEVAVVPSVVERVRQGGRPELAYSEVQRRLGSASWRQTPQATPRADSRGGHNLGSGGNMTSSATSVAPISAHFGPSTPLYAWHRAEHDEQAEEEEKEAQRFASSRERCAEAAQTAIAELDAMREALSFATHCIEEELGGKSDHPSLRFGSPGLPRQDPSHHLERPASARVSSDPKVRTDGIARQGQLQAIRTLVKAIDVAASRWDAMP